VLKIFYGTIVVEGVENIPQTGRPCIVCANHTNSLTDALILVTAIPSWRRNMLHLTAKSTQFGKKTLTSWLIEAAGTVPIQRRKDFVEGLANNDIVMEKMTQTLEMGGAVCLFPEGGSRYHPTIAPLKTGVARIVSAILSRNRNNVDFEISILTCSITYMHRQHFRSDVLVTFHPPLTFRPKDNPELLEPMNNDSIRLVTAQMHRQIATGTFDAPTWGLIRAAKMATPIYAPLGTAMSLGDYVRVTRAFLEVFKAGRLPSAHTSSAGSASPEVGVEEKDEDIVKLKEDLEAYQSKLHKLRIRDDRIRRPLSRPVILYRLVLRFIWVSFLLSISLGGLTLWLPVAATTFYAVRNFKKTGPVWDTWDEIAQYKLIYGLVSGLLVYAATILLTFPIFPITVVVVPLLMWMSLRWFEDAVSAARALAALGRLLRVNPATLARLRTTRADLQGRLMHLAVHGLGLPPNPEEYFGSYGDKDKDRLIGRWASKAEYFSVRRRRKRDWNETLRLYEQIDYPPEDS
jgi:glycerol-3-phosphate O-acyltransferase/dihydroxyacetone phosphate acyltransferase